MHPRVRALGVLLSCAALAAVSLAASGGGGTEPAAAVVRAARAHLGEPYAWGGAGPEAYDCSGLTSTIWAGAGRVKRVPRTSAQQQAWAVPLPAEQVLPGDLVFFGSPVTHVGLVTGRLGHGRLRMIDASASRRKVVERIVWTSGVVRYGRVPRAGMPRVRPWTAPPAARPAPTRAAPAVPLVSPRHPGLAGRPPLVGLPAHQGSRSTRTMTRYLALAQAQVGKRTWSDTGLVTTLWKRAGGTRSPDSRVAITNRTARVLLRNARAGDLVVYPSPGAHVGIYIGNGWMIDASRSLGAVVRRPVWSAPGVQVVRWRA